MLRALLIVVCMALNLALWGTLILAGGLVKLLTFGQLRRRVILGLSWMASRWVGINNRITDAFLSTRWEITVPDGMRMDARCLIISNHVSWIDVFAVSRAFHDRTPFMRFFIKRPLIWAPVVGQACWALDFPFMRRHSPEYLRQHPEKRGRDLETTREALRRYGDVPISILSFVEGTRFSREKHEDQQSPYRFLLRPRVGGIGFVLASLAERLDALYDVTIVYPDRDTSMLDFVLNRVPWIRIDARRVDVPVEFHSAAITQPGPERDHFKQWVEQVWREKDETIAEVLSARGDST